MHIAYAGLFPAAGPSIFIYSSFFFPEVLLQTSNFNKITSFYVYLLMNLGLIVSVMHSWLYECENASYPPDATVILPLQISLSHWDRPFPSRVLNLSFLVEGMKDTRELGVNSNLISTQAHAKSLRRHAAQIHVWLLVHTETRVEEEEGLTFSHA